MNANIEIEILRQVRQVLRTHFKKADSRLLRLFDEPFLNYEVYDNCGRLLEFRTAARGVIVDIRQDMFDAFFSNVGPNDEVRMLTIGTPVHIENNLAKISAACLAWIIEGQSEKVISKLLK